MKSVFVWTVGDVISLGMLALVLGLWALVLGLWALASILEWFGRRK